MAYDRIRIQNALKAEALAGPWTLVRYDRDGVASTDENTEVEPDSTLANEIEGSFSEAERNRRDVRVQERSDWLFQLIVSFSEGEVLGEGFEDRINAGGILLPADKDKGERQITLELDGAQYDHPPQKNPQSGSKVTYTFRAQQAPR